MTEDEFKEHIARVYKEGQRAMYRAVLSLRQVSMDIQSPIFLASKTDNYELKPHFLEFLLPQHDNSPAAILVHESKYYEMTNHPAFSDVALELNHAASAFISLSKAVQSYSNQTSVIFAILVTGWAMSFDHGPSLKTKMDNLIETLT